MSFIAISRAKQCIFTKHRRPPGLQVGVCVYFNGIIDGSTCHIITIKKFCCTEKNDETPRIQDLRAPVLCNPPAL